MYEWLRRFFLFFLTVFGSKKQKDFLKKRIEQDFSKLNSKITYWIHASSVGEVNLLENFMKELLQRQEGEVLLSVFTDTGYETAQQKYKKEARVQICYFPLDDKNVIKKMLQKISLKTLFLVETELWPNLIERGAASARVVVINGRISGKSFQNYQKIRKLCQSLFEKISYFYVQTQEDAERFLFLGAKEEKLQVVGNLKFDLQVLFYSKEEKEEFRKQFSLSKKKVWVAGSTRTGEYETILNAFSKLSQAYFLVLVPRHLERVSEIESLLREKKLSYQRYSNFQKEEKTRILIVDAMGVLRKFYAIADVVFVGGTLVNIGGHSLLEPLCYYKTPMFGPYIQNVKEIAKEIQARELGYVVRTERDILEMIVKIEKQTPEVHEKITAFLEANRRVGEKILEREVL